MRRPLLARPPMVVALSVSLPPMYVWPAPLKRIVLAVCVVLCLAVYALMAAGILGLATVVSQLLYAP
jgi:hypothetical protein